MLCSPDSFRYMLGVPHIRPGTVGLGKTSHQGNVQVYNVRIPVSHRTKARHTRPWAHNFVSSAGTAWGSGTSCASAPCSPALCLEFGSGSPRNCGFPRNSNQMGTTLVPEKPTCILSKRRFLLFFLSLSLSLSRSVSLCLSYFPSLCLSVV